MDAVLIINLFQLGSIWFTIHWWLNMMKRYFKLMRYPTDIWVDVIATRIMHAAQAWLDKSLQAI